MISPDRVPWSRPGTQRSLSGHEGGGGIGELLGLGSDLSPGPADPRMAIPVPLESGELPGREAGGPHVAGRVFHAGAFPTGAHHPLMGPENHGAHPGRAAVAGSRVSRDPHRCCAPPRAKGPMGVLV